jgi:hypothetical protein
MGTQRPLPQNEEVRMAGDKVVNGGHLAWRLERHQGLKTKLDTLPESSFVDGEEQSRVRVTKPRVRVRVSKNLLFFPLGMEGGRAV